MNLTRDAKPAQCGGSIDIEIDDGGLIDWSSQAFAAATTASADFQGAQNQTVTISATPTDDSWYCPATATVNLVLGQKSTAALQIKHKPWVKFKVTEDVTNTQLAGLTLKFTLPSGQQTRVTSATNTTDALKLVPTDVTVSADELDNTVDADIWEFVRLDTAS